MNSAETSHWLKGLSEEPCEQLRRSAKSDVCVVGGGYTGLCCAISLRRLGFEVAIIESHHLGFGASGRNAGHLTPTIGKDLPSLLKLFGEDRARSLVRLADDSVRFVEETISNEGIACDYNGGGNIFAAIDKSQLPKLAKAAGAGARLGAEMEFLDGSAMEKRGIPPAFVGGIWEKCGGTLHSGKYLAGLKRVALNEGVKIYENSPVLQIKFGSPARLTSSEGTMMADRVVLATNAYTQQLKHMNNFLVPMSVALFETAPLTKGERATLQWPKREGIYTAHEILESYRLTAHGTIVGGSKDIRYGYGSKLLADSQPKMFAKIEAAFRQRFPSLKSTQIANYWSGHISIGLDFLPMLGRLGKKGKAFYSAGYAGHGVAMASYLGAVLAHLIAGHRHPVLESPVVNRRRWPLPPEPLRFLTVGAIKGTLAFLDERLDRRVARESQRP